MAAGPGLGERWIVFRGAKSSQNEPHNDDVISEFFELLDSKLDWN